MLSSDPATVRFRGNGLWKRAQDVSQTRQGVAATSTIGANVSHLSAAKEGVRQLTLGRPGQAGSVVTVLEVALLRAL